MTSPRIPPPPGLPAMSDPGTPSGGTPLHTPSPRAFPPGLGMASALQVPSPRGGDMESLAGAMGPPRGSRSSSGASDMAPPLTTRSFSGASDSGHRDIDGSGRGARPLAPHSLPAAAAETSAAASSALEVQGGKSEAGALLAKEAERAEARIDRSRVIQANPHSHRSAKVDDEDPYATPAPPKMNWADDPTDANSQQQQQQPAPSPRFPPPPGLPTTPTSGQPSGRASLHAQAPRVDAFAAAVGSRAPFPGLGMAPGSLQVPSQSGGEAEHFAGAMGPPRGSRSTSGASDSGHRDIDGSGRGARPPAPLPAGAAANGASASSVSEAKGEKSEADALLAKEAARLAKLTLGPETAEARIDRLRVIQANPNSHLCSGTTFEAMNLPPALLKGVQDMQFAKPSAIQEHALPFMLQEPPSNLMAQAQSGSGKTVAFCLGALYRIDTAQHFPQAMIVTPTRELAVQCYEQTLLPMARHMQPPLNVFMALVGNNIERGARLTQHVIIGAPGRIETLIKMRALDLSRMKVFVLDEADQMIAQDVFRDAVMRMMRAMSRNPPQTLLFSATYPPEVEQFAGKLMPGPLNKITLRSDEELVLEEIIQVWVDLRGSHDSQRVSFLGQLYVMLEMGQSIVFCNSRREADRINHELNMQGFGCSNLHGGLEAVDRDACMAAFRTGKNKVLITTNVLARGVDVPSVSLVVNYDMPIKYSQGNLPDFETYLHRIGRTGRFGRAGLAINFVDSDESFGVLQEIERHFSPNRQMITQVACEVEELERFVSNHEMNRKMRKAT